MMVAEVFSAFSRAELYTPGSGGNLLIMILLDSTEVRILGALTEKAITTPDYYPMSLNALTNACNQSSNRDPVMQLDESAVVDAVARLREKALVRATRAADSRVTRYSHLLAEKLSLDTRELAVMCVLMLRGPQTAGEVRTRTARLAEFGDVAEVEQTLTALATREPDQLVQMLERRPGQKESRFAHRLSGDVDLDTPDAAPAQVTGSDRERIAALETAISELRNELSDVRRQLDEFRRQFE